MLSIIIMIQGVHTISVICVTVSFVLLNELMIMVDTD